jgi:hypothetical protein
MWLWWLWWLCILAPPGFFGDFCGLFFLKYGTPYEHCNWITSRCPYCAFGFHCKVSWTGVIDVKSCHSCQITTFMSNHVNSRCSCQITRFLSKLCQNMSNQVVHFISCPSCHSCQIMSLMSFVIGLFRKISKVWGGGRRGQIVFLGLWRQLCCQAEGKNKRLVTASLIKEWQFVAATIKHCRTLRVRCLAT